jgi:hypothetical protein
MPGKFKNKTQNHFKLTCSSPHLNLIWPVRILSFKTDSRLFQI